MEFASKLVPSQTNSAVMVWSVGFGCAEMGSDWLAQAGTHCVAQAICTFALLLLFSVFREEAVNISINLVYVF